MSALRHPLPKQIKPIFGMRYFSADAKQRALSDSGAVDLQRIEVIIPRASFLLQKQGDCSPQASAAAVDGYDPPNAGWKSSSTLGQIKHSFEDQQQQHRKRQQKEEIE